MLKIHGIDGRGLLTKDVQLSTTKQNLKSIIEDYVSAIYELNVIKEARYIGILEANIEFMVEFRRRF